MAVSFSNPRLRAEIPDWPLGGSKRGLCVFAMEHHPKRGYRFTRTTTGKPKTSTYGGKLAIVDGSDGRTYIIQHAGMYQAIVVWRSDFMNPATEDLGFDHYVTPDKYGELYKTLSDLIGFANAAGG